MTWSFRLGQSSRQAFIIYCILIPSSYNKFECTDGTALVSERLRILQGNKNSRPVLVIPHSFTRFIPSARAQLELKLVAARPPESMI
jgi:hypothetical protein